MRKIRLPSTSIPVIITIRICDAPIPESACVRPDRSIPDKPDGGKP